MTGGRIRIPDPTFSDSTMASFRVSTLLADQGDVSHGFFGREGGVSGGLYASLNCSFNADDARDNVRENRDRVVRVLGGHRLVTNRQVHGRDVRIVDADTAAEAYCEADGLVTRDPGVCIGALGADCAPVLLAAPGVVGAAHAGWQGALRGVTDAVIDRMLGPGVERADIVAAIGPAIAPLSYEVGEVFRDRLLAESPVDAGDCFIIHPQTGNVHFDLPGYIELRLRAAGISRVERIAADTYAEESTYFSYRRACHRGEADYGRQVGAICLGPA